MRQVLCALLALGLAVATAPGAEPSGISSIDTPVVVREAARTESGLPPSAAGATTFPRLLHWEPPSRSDAAAGDTLAHFIVCQVDVDEVGRPDTLRVLGCEGTKETLCDRVVGALRSARFRPATIGDSPVASTCVFGVTFRGGQQNLAVAGIPVIGFWADSLCAYEGRIYGSAELAAESRPVVTRRVRAAYPEQARGYPSKARVNLRAVIDTEGAPCFVLCDSAVPSDRGFVEAAVPAAFRFRYEPGKLNGRAQAVWVDIDFRWDPLE